MTNWDLFQERKFGSTFQINQWYVNRLRKKNCVIVSIHIEKSLDKIQHQLILKQNKIKQKQHEKSGSQQVRNKGK